MLVDTDAGFDDLIAMSLLQNMPLQTEFKDSSSLPRTPDIKLITTVPGIQNIPSQTTSYFQHHFLSTKVMTTSNNNNNNNNNFIKILLLLLSIL